MTGRLIRGVLSGAVAGVIVFFVAIFILFRTDEYLARLLLEGEAAADSWVTTIGIVSGVIAFAVVFLWNVARR